VVAAAKISGTVVNHSKFKITNAHAERFALSALSDSVAISLKKKSEFRIQSVGDWILYSTERYTLTILALDD
jgi:hypothetical protein